MFQSEDLHELQISMLGGTGVGKSTLLSVMYEQFDATVGQANLQLTPDPETNARLDRSLTELKKLFDGPLHQSKQGIRGTRFESEFFFGLGKIGQKPSLKLRFVDYPGQYIESQPNVVHEFVRNSAAVLVAIDSPALMEKKGRWNDEINKPRTMLGVFRNTFQDLSTARLVILAPIKCERYLKKQKTTDKLLNGVKEAYSDLLKFFASDSLRDKVAVVITPVQTVGTVHFSRIEMVDGTPVFHYRPVRRDARYEPRDSEQPLRYLLRFLLRLHYQNKFEGGGILDTIRKWLGMDKYLLEAVEKFTSESQTSGGFEIIQGYDLL